MKLKQLMDFIEKKTSMSHIYQLLLIRSLVDADGSATLRKLSLAFLSHDEIQLRYYEKKIRQMPLKVLLRYNVVKQEGELVFLTTRKLTYRQKAKIKMLCENRMQEFVKRKGLGLWDYRLLDTYPVPDSLRFRVLKNSEGRCALCGATKKEHPLHVDHIKPRSKGGKTEYENLQTLCSACLRSKSNRDETDFKVESTPEVDTGCPFCPHKVNPRVVETFDSVVAIKDKYPATLGHMLVIPRRHTPNLFSMTEKERRDADGLMRILQKRILQDDASVTGFNIGMNCGVSAGQRVMHAHIHLIPRRDGDNVKPKEGKRCLIHKKMNYKN